MNRKASTLVCVFLWCVLSASAGSAQSSLQADRIRAVLAAQVESWDRGDLEGYMLGYWHSPELTFYSGGTVTKGWAETLQRYRKRYQGEGRAMGKLTFSDLDIQQLSPETAWVGGRWRLEMSDGSHPGGLFTLTFRKFPEGWRIVHDHTSSEP